MGRSIYSRTFLFIVLFYLDPSPRSHPALDEVILQWLFYFTKFSNSKAAILKQSIFLKNPRVYRYEYGIVPWIVDLHVAA